MRCFYRVASRIADCATAAPLTPGRARCPTRPPSLCAMESSFQRLGRGRRLRKKIDEVLTEGAVPVDGVKAAEITGDVPRNATLMDTQVTRRSANAHRMNQTSTSATPVTSNPTASPRKTSSNNLDGTGTYSATPSTPHPGSTRPGLYGQTLVSCGLSDVDDLLGGGVPLGSVILLGTDTGDDSTNRDCGNASTLIRYFVAEGVASGHTTLWMPPRRMNRSHAKTLPKVVDADANAKDDDKNTKDAKNEDDGLRIAWQYRRYLQQGKSLDDSRVGGRGVGGLAAGVSATGGSEVGKEKKNTGGVRRLPSMCHTFDLTRETDGVTASTCDLRCAPFVTPVSLGEMRDMRDTSNTSSGNTNSSSETKKSLANAYAECVELVSRCDASDDGPVGRIALQFPTRGEYIGGSENDSIDQLCLFLKSLRGVLRGSKKGNSKNVCVLVTYPLKSLPHSLSSKLIHAVDACLALETLPEKNVRTGEQHFIEQLLPDPNLCVALLRVRKISFPGPGAVANNILTRMDRVYALQVRRKRLAVKPLRIAPEDAGVGKELTKNGEKKKSSLCGSGPPSASNALDF